MTVVLVLGLFTFCYSFCYRFGLLSGLRPHLILIALVIPYSGNAKALYGSGVTLGVFHIKKCQCCYPFLLPLFWVAVRGKATIKMDCIDHSYSGNTKALYGSGVSLGAVQVNTFQCCYPFLLPLFGLLSGVKPHLKLLALVIPYSGNPNVL